MPRFLVTLDFEVDAETEDDALFVWRTEGDLLGHYVVPSTPPPDAPFLLHAHGRVMSPQPQDDAMRMETPRGGSSS